MTEVMANLVFDSWSDSLPELRGRPSEERHLIYEGAGVLLDLLLKPSVQGASLHVEGQVLPADDMAEDVAHVPVLLENGSVSHKTQTNALGEFRFEHAPSNGCFDISIVFGGRRFLVRGLESQEPRDWQVVVANAATAGPAKREPQ